MSRIKWNAFANLAGTAWGSVLAIALVPVYLRYLGIEAYGLVGIFATMQAGLIIFDLGLGLTLTRVMVRMSVQPDAIRNRRDLLRTAELLYWAIALFIGLAIVVAAGPIARNWIKESALPTATVVRAVQWMGIISAIHFPIALYRAALLGLDRQVTMNAAMIVLGTVRSVGAVAVLVFVSPSIIAFFTWQALATLSLTLTLALSSWRILRAPVRPVFRASLLKQEWQYASIVSASLILNIIITNIDKVVLSAVLSLAAFGYYALASMLATAPALITVPLNTALFPRFTELFETGSETDLASLYHTASQSAAVLVFPGAALLACFSREILHVWTRDSLAAANAGLPLSLLVVGTTLVNYASIAAYMAAAGGRPEVMTKTNAVAVIAIVPGMLIVAPRFGAVGAAALWIAISCFHVFGAVPLAHRRLLPRELGRWYLDAIKPLLAIAVVTIPARRFFPRETTAGTTVTWLVLIFVASSLAALMAAPRVRAVVIRLVRGVLATLSPRPR